VPDASPFAFSAIAVTSAMDLQTFYDFWVNGETLSRWQLTMSCVSGGPEALSDAASVSPGDALQWTLPRFRSTANIQLDVDSSKLKPIYQVLVHGSQATNDACDFSDIDILVVLDDSRAFTAREHAEAVAELKALLRSMFLYDNLMHHGFMFMLRSRFDNYDESYLPAETLRNAALVHGTPQITLRKAIPLRLRLKQRLHAAAESLSRRLERRDHERNDYAFKSVLSGLLLLPSLLLESIDVFVYKRDSFSTGPRQFPNLDWSAIGQAEDIRLNWKRPPTSITQKMISKISHPQAIIRLTRMNASKLNVNRLLGEREESFRRKSQEFLACLASQ